MKQSDYSNKVYSLEQYNPCSQCSLAHSCFQKKKKSALNCFITSKIVLLELTFGTQDLRPLYHAMSV